MSTALTFPAFNNLGLCFAVSCELTCIFILLSQKCGNNLDSVPVSCCRTSLIIPDLATTYAHFFSWCAFKITTVASIRISSELIPIDECSFSPHLHCFNSNMLLNFADFVNMLMYKFRERNPNFQLLGD